MTIYIYIFNVVHFIGLGHTVRVTQVPHRYIPVKYWLVDFFLRVVVMDVCGARGMTWFGVKFGRSVLLRVGAEGVTSWHSWGVRRFTVGARVSLRVRP
jgi:hypothetical protein